MARKLALLVIAIPFAACATAATTLSDLTGHIEFSLGPGQSGSSQVSSCSLTGDFDVQVNYTLIQWPPKNPYGLRLGAADLPVGRFGEPGIYRNSGPMEFYTFVSSQNASQQRTTDSSGVLRLVRSGSGLQGLVSHNGGWVTIGSGQAGNAATRIDLELAGTSTPGVVDVAFDDFTLNSGTVTCGSTPPAISSQFGPPSTTAPFGSVAEPINTATGNYYTSHSDLAVPGKGLSFKFTRFYNSLDTSSGSFGMGWTHSYNLSLTVNPDSSVSLRNGDGSAVTFAATATGYAAQTPGLFDTLAKNADGSFTLTRKNQIKFNFSALGQLQSIMDRNGNTQVLSYSGGNLTMITDSSSRTFSLSYDGSGHVLRLTDPLNRSVQYTYDSAGRLTSVTDQIGGLTQYTYDVTNRLSSAVDARGVIYLQNSYDSLGRVVAQENGRQFTTTFAYATPTAGTTTITDPQGNQTRDIYDANLRLIAVVDAAGNITLNNYDANNDRTSFTDRNDNTTQLTYDAQGNATSITDPLGNSQHFSYNAQNNLLSKTDAKGNTTSFFYDAKGNLTGIRNALNVTTSFMYDLFGELTAATDANGHSSHFSYDSEGDLIQITDPLSYSTTFKYDGLGRLLSASDPNSHTASATYDALNRLLAVTDPLGGQTRFSYDPIGNLLMHTDANGHSTTYAYDAVSKLTSVRDALGNISRYAYDANGNRTAFTNAKGNNASYAYDSLNRLVAATDPLSNTTRYVYDAVGNFITKIDANGTTNQFSYDGNSRLTLAIYGDSNRVMYNYDVNGSRTAIIEPSWSTSYEYDAVGRLTSVSEPQGQLVRYFYDAVGNRTLMFYAGVAISYDYDPANRLIGANDWTGRTTVYQYDPAGNLIHTAYANGVTAAFFHDPANRLTQISYASLFSGLPTISYGLDAVGNRLSQSINQVTTSYTYDPLNQLISAQQGSQMTTWTYDQVGNRTAQVSWNPKTMFQPATTPYSYDAADELLSAGTTNFAYDRDGNRISMTGSAGAVKYLYDSANRLIQVSGPSGNNIFTYDGDNNRLSEFTQGRNYFYTNDLAVPLPMVLNQQGPDGSTTFAYGLSLFESVNNFYLLDGLGSVVGLTDASGAPAASYQYDAWGNAQALTPDITTNPFGFAGQAFDPGTGLYHMRARYYDPTVGRFLSRDPLGGGLPGNRYAYANNSPINQRDPSGLSAEPSGLSTNSLTTPQSILNTQNTASAFNTALQETLQQALMTPYGQILKTLPTFALCAGGVLNIGTSCQQAGLSQAQIAVGNDIGTLVITIATAGVGAAARIPTLVNDVIEIGNLIASAANGQVAPDSVLSFAEDLLSQSLGVNLPATAEYIVNKTRLSPLNVQ